MFRQLYMQRDEKNKFFWDAKKDIQMKVVIPTISEEELISLKRGLEKKRKDSEMACLSLEKHLSVIRQKIDPISDKDWDQGVWSAGRCLTKSEKGGVRKLVKYVVAPGETPYEEWDGTPRACLNFCTLVCATCDRCTCDCDCVDEDSFALHILIS